MVWCHPQSGVDQPEALRRRDHEDGLALSSYPRRALLPLGAGPPLFVLCDRAIHAVSSCVRRGLSVGGDRWRQDTVPHSVGLEPRLLVAIGGPVIRWYF